MEKTKKEPVRLCLACREKNYKQNLIRIVKEKNGKIFIDILKKAQGRGAYLCYNKKCLDILKKKKALEKNFKCQVDGKIYNELEERIINI